MAAGRKRLIKRLMMVSIAAICLLQPRRFLGDSTLAIETFQYSVGSLQNTNGGSGWAGPWQVQNNNLDVPGYNVSAGSPFVYTGLTTSGHYETGGDAWLTAGRLLDTSSGGAFSKYLSSQLIGLPGTTLFFGALMRKDIDTDDPMTVTLHPGNPAWWVNSPGIAMGHFGVASNVGNTRFWSLSVNGVVYRTAVPIVVGQPAFLVACITFGSSNRVSLYVDPPAGSLPATPDAQATASNSIAFQSVALYNGAGPNQSSIDEIRFASGYSGLIAGAMPPLSPPLIAAAVPGNQMVTLSWVPTSGASEYLVYQIENGVTQLAATLSSCSFPYTGLTNGSAYSFYVVASNATSKSAPSAQVTAVPRGPAPPSHPALGSNLAGVADYSRELTFVDAFKSARPWIAQQQGMPWGGGAPLQLNDQGWITSLQPGQYAETIMLDNALDDHADYPAGQYTLLYDGSGTLSFDLQSATIVSQTPGRMVVNVPTGLNGIFLIESATESTNPIRNIRFILPGFESTYRSQPFHPLFLKSLQNYQVLRFMEWMATNNSTVQNWSDRATPEDYTYSWRGVPLEVMISLANTMNAKPWFNIPAQANDQYVKKFASLVHKKLNPALSYYVEYSNETWNSMFSQSQYIEAQGNALGFDTNPTLNGADYTAYRSVQIFRIFQSLIGTPTSSSSGQIIRVIASQAENSWLSNQTLGFQNAFANADVLAIAPYFNCSDASTGGFGVLGDPATVDEVATMSISQVESILGSHINNCALQEMQSNAVIAASYGLKMVGYEGGQSLGGFNGAENNTAMTNLFKATNRDANMGPLYAQYLQNWVAAGGDMFVHYSDVAAYTKNGYFGALEYQDQAPASSPKFTALTTFAGQHP